MTHSKIKKHLKLNTLPSGELTQMSKKLVILIMLEILKQSDEFICNMFFDIIGDPFQNNTEMQIVFPELHALIIDVGYKLYQETVSSFNFTFEIGNAWPVDNAYRINKLNSFYGTLKV